MKTTIQIPNSLFGKAKKLASLEGTTLRALIEEALRRLIEERSHTTAFRLRKATFQGRGLQSHLKGASWDRLRDMAYEGRGG